MICPVCDAKMRTVEKHNVEVDICPDCKGVWLDRGELDKVIEMVSSDEAQPRSREERPREERKHEDGKRYDNEHGHDRGVDQRTGRPKKRGSLLTDIFEAIGGGGD